MPSQHGQPRHRASGLAATRPTRDAPQLRPIPLIRIIAAPEIDRRGHTIPLDQAAGSQTPSAPCPARPGGTHRRAPASAPSPPRPPPSNTARQPAPRPAHITPTRRQPLPRKPGEQRLVEPRKRLRRVFQLRAYTCSYAASAAPNPRRLAVFQAAARHPAPPPFVLRRIVSRKAPGRACRYPSHVPPATTPCQLAKWTEELGAAAPHRPAPPGTPPPRTTQGPSPRAPSPGAPAGRVPATPPPPAAPSPPRRQVAAAADTGSYTASSATPMPARPGNHGHESKPASPHLTERHVIRRRTLRQRRLRARREPCPARLHPRPGLEQARPIPAPAARCPRRAARPQPRHRRRL